MQDARENLERFRWSVDYVLTHDCSEKMKIFLSMGQQSNSLNQFLTEIERKLQFHKWFFGFYHLDKQIPPRALCRIPVCAAAGLGIGQFFTFCTNKSLKAGRKKIYFFLRFFGCIFSFFKNPLFYLIKKSFLYFILCFFYKQIPFSVLLSLFCLFLFCGIY